MEAVDRSLLDGGRPAPVGEVDDETISEPLRGRVAEIKPGPPVPEAGNIGTAILGGGPAGLTAAYVLGHRGHRGTIFEADGSVGGIAGNKYRSSY